MSNHGRPLSPHLTVYRWPITMLLSILHRMTGVAMAVGLIVLTAWLMNARGRAGAVPVLPRESWGRARSVSRCSSAGLSRFSCTSATAFATCSGTRAAASRKSQANASAWVVLLCGRRTDRRLLGVSAVSLRSPLGRVLGPRQRQGRDGPLRQPADLGDRACHSRALVPVLDADDRDADLPRRLPVPGAFR